MTVIRIKDSDKIYSSAFDHLLKFRGTKRICGLTVPFKIMKPEVVLDGFVARRRHLKSGNAPAAEVSAIRQLQIKFSDLLRAFEPAKAVNVFSFLGVNQ